MSYDVVKHTVNAGAEPLAFGCMLQHNLVSTCVLPDNKTLLYALNKTVKLE